MSSGESSWSHGISCVIVVSTESAHCLSACPAIRQAEILFAFVFLCFLVRFLFTKQTVLWQWQPWAVGLGSGSAAKFSDALLLAFPKGGGQYIVVQRSQQIRVQLSTSEPKLQAASPL